MKLLHFLRSMVPGAGFGVGVGVVVSAYGSGTWLSSVSDYVELLVLAAAIGALNSGFYALMDKGEVPSKGV